jgi:2,3-dihydroxybiphenyl 1,2-dioxygenase
VGFEVSDLGAWETFATRVLGLEIGGRRDGDALSLRMDSRAARIFIERGGADDLSVLGWEVADEGALVDVAGRLRAAGVEVLEGTRADAARRHVVGLVKFTDPAGVPSEVFFGPEKAGSPFQSRMVQSGFVAEEQGVGHAVITANDQAESLKFYGDVLGFRLSDFIVCDLHGYDVNIAFLHTNQRHHTVAFGGRQKKRIHHFMLEVGGMDDVGLAFDRTLRAGLRIMQTLGKHPNDQMFSFYAKTPSGFQFELGCGGRRVDDATWAPTTYDRISEWGHHSPEAMVPKARRETTEKPR